MKFILGQQKLSLKSSILGIGFAESRTLFTENSQKVEKWIQISHFALLNVTPILSICPALIVSAYLLTLYWEIQPLSYLYLCGNEFC